jgi:hypothetical protein
MAAPRLYDTEPSRFETMPSSPSLAHWRGAVFLDLGERWPSRLVATAAEDRLNIPAQPSHIVAAVAERFALRNLLAIGSGAYPYHRR